MGQKNRLGEEDRKENAFRKYTRACLSNKMKEINLNYNNFEKPYNQ